MSLRTEPVRARSSARVRALIDATAEVTDVVGVDRVTTNLVAERAGCSIGTLYRYFPDRIAVIRALALRNASTMHEDFQHALSLVSPDESGLEQVLLAMSEKLITRFRDDSGWSAIGFGHALDLPLSASEQNLVSPPLRGRLTPRAQIARDVAIRFSDDDTQLRGLSGHIEVALLMTQALVDRAFAASHEGDPAMLDVARTAFFTIANSVAEAHRERRQV